MLFGETLQLASTGSRLGIPMGFGIGLLSGIVVGLFLAAAWSNQSDLFGAFRASKWLLTLPAGWYGGAWASGKLLESLDFEAVLPSYILSFTLSMVIVALLVMFTFSKWIRQKPRNNGS